MVKSLIYLASTNDGKVKDFENMMKDYQVKSIKDLDIKFNVEEDRDTFEGNALKKAKALYKIIKKPVVGDDSGLMIKKLNNFPGVFSARWAYPECNFFKINDLLLKKLQENNLILPEDRFAVFKTVLAYFDGKNEVFFEGILEGTIAYEQKGENGFGYAPIFVPSGYNVTQAEMTEEQRRATSHRKKAIDKLVEWLDINNE